MSRAIVLVEEDSALVFVREIASRLDIAARTTIIRFDGKNDLDRSIPVKLGRWQSPEPFRFLILRDSDGGDCLALKSRLKSLIPPHASMKTRIRIVVQELEAWYFGDPDALRVVGYPAVASACARAKFRTPDAIRNPKSEIKRLIPFSGQIALARQMAPHLSLTHSRSPSFLHFVSALKWAAG